MAKLNDFGLGGQWINPKIIGEKLHDITNMCFCALVPSKA